MGYLSQPASDRKPTILENPRAWHICPAPGTKVTVGGFPIEMPCWETTISGMTRAAVTKYADDGGSLDSITPMESVELQGHTQAGNPFHLRILFRIEAIPEGCDAYGVGQDRNTDLYSISEKWMVEPLAAMHIECNVHDVCSLRKHCADWTFLAPQGVCSVCLSNPSATPPPQW